MCNDQCAKSIELVIIKCTQYPINTCTQCTNPTQIVSVRNIESFGVCSSNAIFFGFSTFVSFCVKFLIFSAMILFLILIATSIVAFLVQTILLVYQRDKKYVKNIPSVPFWTMTKFVTFKNSSVDTFNKIEEVIGYHTGMAKFWVGTKLVLFCEDPVNMKTILMSKNCVEKPDYYRFIAGTGDGLFTAHGNAITHHVRVEIRKFEFFFSVLDGTIDWQEIVGELTESI